MANETVAGKSNGGEINWGHVEEHLLKIRAVVEVVSSKAVHDFGLDTAAPITNSLWIVSDELDRLNAALGFDKVAGVTP